MDDGSLDDNVESFLSQDDPEPRDRVGRCGDVSKGTVNVDFLSYWWNAFPHTNTCKFSMRDNRDLIIL